MRRCSTRFLASLTAVSATVLCGIAVNGPGASQPTATPSGTLTCTVADAPSNGTSIVDLSCNYKSYTGAASDYVGSAGTESGGFPAKFVFMWSVLAIDVGKGPVLDGTFTAKTGREGPAVLIGGKDGTTRLEPATGVSQLPGPAKINTLTLKLFATKA